MIPTSDYGNCPVPICSGRLRATDSYTDVGRPIVRCDRCGASYRITVEPDTGVPARDPRKTIAETLAAAAVQEAADTAQFNDAALFSDAGGSTPPLCDTDRAFLGNYVAGRANLEPKPYPGFPLIPAVRVTPEGYDVVLDGQHYLLPTDEAESALVAMHEAWEEAEAAEAAAQKQADAAAEADARTEADAALFNVNGPTDESAEPTDLPKVPTEVIPLVTVEAPAEPCGTRVTVEAPTPPAVAPFVTATEPTEWPMVHKPDPTAI